MKTLGVGMLIASALALQACATSGTERAANYSEADQLIMRVMTPDELTCPTNMTKFCSGSSRLSMQCSCEHPQAIQAAFSSYSGYHW